MLILYFYGETKNIMKKKIVLTLLVLSLLDVYSQVGINTSNSKITLDVAGNSTQPAIQNGIIAPKITVAQPKKLSLLTSVK